MYVTPHLDPSSDLTVQFENPAYTLSEGETITVNVVASTDFSKAFSVAISHNGGGGKHSLYIQPSKMCIYVCTCVHTYV